MGKRWSRRVGATALMLSVLVFATPTSLVASAPTIRNSNPESLRHVLDSTSAAVASNNAAVGAADINDRGYAARSPSGSSKDGSVSPQPTTAPPLSKTNDNAYPVPDWLRQSTTVGVLTSSVNPTPTHGDGLVDGTVVLIADKYAITSTKLLSTRGLDRLRNSSATHAVLFSSDASRVKRAIFQSDYSGNKDHSLIVLELVANQLSSPVVPIVTAKPVKNFEFETLSIINTGSVLDSKVLELDGVTGSSAIDPLPEISALTFLLEPVCGYSPPPPDSTLDDLNQLCVGQLPKQPFTSPQEQWKLKKEDQGQAGGKDRGRQLKQNQHGPKPAPPKPGTNAPTKPTTNSTQPSAPIQHVTDKATQTQTNPAVLLYNGHVVGLPIPLKSSGAPWAVTADEKQGFLRLAATENKEFIDYATQSSAQYSATDMFDQESKFPSYLASFISEDGNQVNCYGVLIAPRYVLTTASCPELASITRVFFSTSANAVGLPVRVVREHTATHPRYQVGDPTFDTAVLELASDVAFTPIQVDDGSYDVSNGELARVRFADTYFEVSALTPALDPATCANKGGDQFQQNEALCVQPLPQLKSKFSPKDVVGDETIAKYVEDFEYAKGAALVTLSGPTGLALVGLGIGAATADSRRQLTESSTELYVRVANSATFINAYVTGISWSKSIAIESFSIEVVEDPSLPALLPENERFVVGLRTTKDGQNYCGGSLIAPSYVLTAAHCVVDGPPNYASIGAYASSGVENEVIAVIKTRIHPQYGKARDFSYDVAILELAYSSASTPVKLSTTVDFLHRESATMYGYGMLSTTSGLSQTLRAVTMPLWSEASCQALFGDRVDDSMLCAGGEKGKDACQGDSGGPLVYAKTDGSNVLVGVVSAGVGCGTADYPGVYARIQSMKSFVQSYVVGASWEAALVSSDTGSSTSTSSSGTSSSSAPIEPRDAASAEDRDNDASRATTGTYNVAQLVLSDLSPLVRDALMDFLLGEDVEYMLTPEIVTALRDSDNVLKFYSTADLAALIATVRRHNKSALNSRTDRFGRWASGYTTGAGQCSAQK